jgi:hypothetical protein
VGLVKALRFAEDQAMLAGTQEKLQETVAQQGPGGPLCRAKVVGPLNA